jgi:hypothetical protein
MFEGKPGAYSIEVNSGVPIQGRLLAFPTNIRLGWKGFPGKKHSGLF